VERCLACAADSGRHAPVPEAALSLKPDVS